jgi:glycosyltransferase involved in cell wall biosynthesis
VAWAVKEHLAVKWADRILTVSEASRVDLIKWFRLDPRRVVAATEGANRLFRRMPEGAESNTVLGRYGAGAGARYLLYVGGLSPHKNLPRLIEAFGRSAPGDVRLILVGDFNDTFHTHVPAIRRAIAAEGLVHRVHFAGFVPDADLVFLYSRAEALVFPSLLEGFGLPAVEAMACGAPVLHSDAGSLPEVVGDAGLEFDPWDVESIAGAIRMFFGDEGLRERLGERALRRSERFTWEESARLILECFDSLDEGKARADAGLKHRFRGHWGRRRGLRDRCR